MPTVVKTALLCDYAVTGQDGKLSVMGIFSNINFGGLPSAYPRFFAVIIMGLDQGTHSISMGIIDPVGEELVPPQPFDVPVELLQTDTNLVVEFNSLGFSRPGRYKVQIFVEGRLTHTMFLDINVMPQEGMPPAQA